MVSGCQFSRTREGAIAQLGERLNGIQEVVGSIPISSTNKNKGLRFLIVSPCFVPAPFEKNGCLPARAGNGVNGPPLPRPLQTFCPGGQAWQWLQKKAPISFAVRIAAKAMASKKRFAGQTLCMPGFAKVEQNI